MEANRTASLGGMANELAGTRNSLEESQKAVHQLLTEKNHICRDLKEVSFRRVRRFYMMMDWLMQTQSPVVS